MLREINAAASNNTASHLLSKFSKPFVEPRPSTVEKINEGMQGTTDMKNAGVNTTPTNTIDFLA